MRYPLQSDHLHTVGRRSRAVIYTRRFTSTIHPSANGDSCGYAHGNPDRNVARRHADTGSQRTANPHRHPQPPIGTGCRLVNLRLGLHGNGNTDEENCRITLGETAR